MGALWDLEWSRVVLWITIISVLIVIIYEKYSESIEGFIDESSLSPVASNFWARLVPRRSDVGPELEIIGINRDKHYFSGYADVQRFSAKTDFCRMVNQGPDESTMFFACALGGTDNTSSTSYKSITVKEGLKLSRDDYMNDTNGDGRDDYCRIVKAGASFEPQCNPATDTGFDKDMLLDPNPPPLIKTILSFYNGAMIWLRFYDDTFDYSQNLILRPNGGLAVNDKVPKPKKTKGLVFNGIDHYLRIGDDRKMALGNKVLPRSMRAISFWVKFEEFTNNAHIFDFGNGAGIDNVWIGIQGTGNASIGSGGAGDFLTKICKGIGAGNETLPTEASGQQPELEVSPETLMKTTSANVDEYDCKEMAVDATPPPRSLKDAPLDIKKFDMPETADMIYEIWEQKTRKQRIKVPGAFVKGKWVHVAVTAAKLESFRPDIVVYINGEMKFVQPSGCLPATGRLTNNFLGKSNWSDATSQFANKDELFKGAIFDFRVYSVPMSKSLIDDTVAWGKSKLGL
jgi:hypothetical protein